MSAMYIVSATYNSSLGRTSIQIKNETKEAAFEARDRVIEKVHPKAVSVSYKGAKVTWKPSQDNPKVYVLAGA